MITDHFRLRDIKSLLLSNSIANNAGVDFNLPQTYDNSWTLSSVIVNRSIVLMEASSIMASVYYMNYDNICDYCLTVCQAHPRKQSQYGILYVAPSRCVCKTCTRQTTAPSRDSCRGSSGSWARIKCSFYWINVGEPSIAQWLGLFDSEPTIWYVCNKTTFIYPKPTKFIMYCNGQMNRRWWKSANILR